MRTIILMSFILLTTVLSCYGQSNTGKAAGIEKIEEDEYYCDSTIIKYCYLIKNGRHELYDKNIFMKYIIDKHIEKIQFTIKRKEYYFEIKRKDEDENSISIYMKDKDVWLIGNEENMTLYLYGKELLLTNNKLEN